jgi:hypothetical protein
MKDYSELINDFFIFYTIEKEGVNQIFFLIRIYNINTRREKKLRAQK